jgi:hypothetical protein
MAIDATSVFAATGVLKVQVKHEQVMSVYADPKIRNGFDTAERFTSALGPVALAAGLIFAANDRKDYAAVAGGVGGGGIAVGLLLKSLFGSNEQTAADKSIESVKKGSEQLSKSLQQLELSRRAYDDLEAQVRIIRNFRDKSSQRLDTLKRLMDRGDALYSQVSAGTAKRIDVINHVDDVLKELASAEILSRFFLEHTTEVITRARLYRDTYPGQLQQGNLKELIEEAEKTQKEFEEKVQKPFLDPLPKFASDLQTWRQRAYETLRK